MTSQIDVKPGWLFGRTQTDRFAVAARIGYQTVYGKPIDLVQPPILADRIPRLRSRLLTSPSDLGGVDVGFEPRRGPE
jgi:hypothetical protein